MMFTPAAHTIQHREATQPETGPAKPKGKAASRAADADFSRFLGQFQGAGVQNTQQTGREISADPGPHGVAAQPAAGASAALPENAARFPGVEGPAAPSGEGSETADPAIAAPGSTDNAGIAGTGGNEDALMPASRDKAAANNAVGAGPTPSHKAGDPPSQNIPDLHDLTAKQDPPGISADENKTGEPADTGRSSPLSTGGDFHTVMHRESSGVQNEQAQISGATITHRSHAGNESAPLRNGNAADVLDTAPSIMKDGNRLAVKFEQDGLGKLDIDLRLNKGIINAQIQVANDNTKTLIENNMQQIVDSLLKAGLSVGGFSVSLRGGGRQNGSPEEQYGYGTERATGAEGEAAGIARRAAADGLVSIFI
jgi:flagellar hook-length control protein FliK